MKWIMAWIKKYLLGVKSPSAMSYGYDYEWDYLKARKDVNENGY